MLSAVTVDEDATRAAMSATRNRIEKYKGATLVVRDDWVSVVWDATGHSFEGPVESEEDLRRVLRIAIDALRSLVKETT